MTKSVKVDPVAMMTKMMTMTMMTMMLETCAARNMDLSGGRQAEARGSAFVAALRNSQ